MRAVIQRVTRASVTVDEKVKGSIANGLMILLGIGEQDHEEDIEWLSGKMVNLRVFNDRDGMMNKSVIEINGDILLISQFTLFASTKKGNRPSYVRSAKPDISAPLYDKMIIALEKMLNRRIQTGTFGADMKVDLLNDGPVTIIIDSKARE